MSRRCSSRFPPSFVERLAAARPILLALASVATTYTLLSAGPQVLFDVFGSRSGSFDFQVFWVSVAQAAGTLMIAVAAWKTAASEWRPALRMRHAGPGGLATGLVGSALLVGFGLALPAGILGRMALQPVAFGRDFPLLGPANALQAFSQEVQFRGLLLGALERTMSPRWANVCQAAVFALAHLAISDRRPRGAVCADHVPRGARVRLAGAPHEFARPAVIIHAVADIALQFGVVPGLDGF